VDDAALVIGLGCRRGCPVAALRSLVDSSLREHGTDLRRIAALATINLKSAEPGLLELAGQLGVPLIVLSAEQLAPFEAQLTHRSALAFARTGCHGIAESAALAGASQLATGLRSGPAQLLIPRRKSSQATIALAFAPVRGG
jgi:cobalt-precorrin 5A hydrolase